MKLQHLLQVNKQLEKNSTVPFQVSDELHNLVKFIIEAINCEVVKKPVFEAAEKPLVRNLKYFQQGPL